MKEKIEQAMIDDHTEIFAQYTVRIIAAFLNASSEEKERKKLVEESIILLRQLQRLWVFSDISEEEISHELQERMILSTELLKKGIRARKDGSYRSTKLP